MYTPLPCQAEELPLACAVAACLLYMQFPYYTFVDRSKMYSVGSLFYAIYFFVSFPMFMRIEEDPKGPKWSLGQVRLTHPCGCWLLGVICCCCDRLLKANLPQPNCPNGWQQT